MTKSELVDAIAEESGLTKADSERALKACIGSIEGALKKGDAVSLIGFGTFSVVQRAARTGRNPREPEGTQRNLTKLRGACRNPSETEETQGTLKQPRGT